MARTIVRLHVRLLVVALLLGGMACGDLQSHLQRVVITGAAEVPAGTTREWTATAIRYDGEALDVTQLATWSIDAAQVATLDRGALTGVAIGTANISATYEGLTAGATVAVVDPVLTSIVIRSVSRLPLGVAQQLVVTGTFSDGSSGDVTARAAWHSSEPTTVEVSETGIVHAVALGTAMVTAMIDAHETAMSIEVTDAAIATIEITPTTATLAKGLERHYDALGHFTDGTTLEIGDQVTWESSAWAIATVSVDGTVRGLRQGLATISARLGSGYGKLDLQVTQPVPIALAIASHDGTLPRGFAQQLVAIASMSDGSRRDLTPIASWASSSPAIAAIGGGRVEATALGLATLSATVDGAEGPLTATSQLEVTDARLVALALAVGEPQLPVGYGEDLVATGTFDDGSTEDLTSQVSYTTSAAHVVVSPAGRARGQSPGSATVTATRDLIAGMLELAVIDAAIATVTIAPDNAVVPLADALQLIATGTFSDGRQYPLTDDVIWTSSSEAVARVGKGLVTPVSPGMATITALTGPNQSVFDQTSVTIAP